MSAAREIISALVAGGMDAIDAASLVARASVEMTAGTGRSSNAERQQRYRDRNKSVTERNANVTPLQADERNETVTNRNETVTRNIAPIDNNKKKEKKERGSQLPDGWRPDGIRWDSVCRKIGTTAAETELSKFTSHHRAKGTVFKNWSFGWDKWLLQSEQWRPKVTATTEMPSFSTPADIDWKNVLSFYKKSGIWSKWAGPDPDSAACKAPPELLREFGLLKTA